MMSAGKGATAANGEQYYYQRDPMIPEDKQNGQWVGKGAQSLGLVGAVDFKDFQAVLRGQDPRTGEQLVEIKNGTDPEQRRAYNDYTFSAGKSLSIAYGAGVDELKELWDESVLATVGIMEGHYSHARVDGVHVNGSLRRSTAIGLSSTRRSAQHVLRLDKSNRVKPTKYRFRQTPAQLRPATNLVNRFSLPAFGPRMAR